MAVAAQTETGLLWPPTDTHTNRDVGRKWAVTLLHMPEFTREVTLCTQNVKPCGEIAYVFYGCICTCSSVKTAGNSIPKSGFSLEGEGRAGAGPGVDGEVYVGTEEPDGLQSTRLRRAGHNEATQHAHTHVRNLN